MSNLYYNRPSHPENPFMLMPIPLERAKLEKRDSLSPKNSYKNFDTVGSAGSLSDLENVCMATNNGRESLVFSMCSTNDWAGADSRSLTRMQSLEQENAQQVEIDVTPKFSAGFTTAAQILEEDDADSEVCAEMSFKVEGLPSITEESPTESDGVPSYWSICPTFEQKMDENNSDYFLCNKNKTLIGNSKKKFSTVYAQNPLPTIGRTKFSVQVDNTFNENPRLYVGFVEGELKGRNIAYKPGYYFVNAFSGESYLNGLRILNNECLFKEGEVISVVVDMDLGLVIFEKNDVEILRGKLNVKKTGKKEFYPCVAIGELKGEVSFIWN